MNCLKCNGNNFIIESTIILTEKYKIQKNGRVAEHPFEKKIDIDNAADYDHIIRCVNCKQGYSLQEKSRIDLLKKTDFTQIDLIKDAELTNF
jgi:hypothetical protein